MGFFVAHNNATTAFVNLLSFSLLSSEGDIYILSSDDRIYSE